MLFYYFVSIFSFYSNRVLKYLSNKSETYTYKWGISLHFLKWMAQNEFLTVQLRHIRLLTFNSYYSFKSLKKILLFPHQHPKVIYRQPHLIFLIYLQFQRIEWVLQNDPTILWIWRQELYIMVQVKVIKFYIIHFKLVKFLLVFIWITNIIFFYTTINNFLYQ